MNARLMWMRWLTGRITHPSPWIDVAIVAAVSGRWSS
jgi:hypothetical protein